MKICVYLYNGVTALDAIGPYESLSRIPETEILFVGMKKGIVRTGDSFVGLTVDESIENVARCDLLIIPGGNAEGLKREIQNRDLSAWIKQIDKQSQWTCSVCTGSLIIASTGLLKNKKASTHWNAREYLANFEVIYSESRITTTGKYITSAGVSAGIDMGLILCEQVAGREIAEAVEFSMEYAPEPPFNTGNRPESRENLTKLVRERLRI